MQVQGLSYSRVTSTKNNFLFNGKEAQPDIDPNWYDYGSRMYMADIGRWNAVDPAADLMQEWSTYNYNYNNPINYIDPDGSIPWPIRKFFLSSGFRKGRPDGEFGEQRRTHVHLGIDLNFSGGGNTDRGAAVRSTHSGKVIAVGKYDTHKNSSGNYIKIQDANGNIRTVYMHLDEVSVEEGDEVLEGQEIGKLGGSGYGRKNAHTAHLHYEIRVKNSDGEFQQIDPWSGGNEPVDPQVLSDGGSSVSDIVSSLEKSAKVQSGVVSYYEGRLERKKKKGKDTSGVERRIAKNKAELKQINNLISAISELLE